MDPKPKVPINVIFNSESKSRESTGIGGNKVLKTVPQIAPAPGGSEREEDLL